MENWKQTERKLTVHKYVLLMSNWQNLHLMHLQDPAFVSQSSGSDSQLLYLSLAPFWYNTVNIWRYQKASSQSFYIFFCLLYTNSKAKCLVKKKVLTIFLESKHFLHIWCSKDTLTTSIIEPPVLFPRKEPFMLSLCIMFQIFHR